MKLHSLIFVAALSVAGCAAPQLTPLSSEHPAYAATTSAPLAQTKILDTYRPAIETRTTPNQNTFPKTGGKATLPADSGMDHAAMGHGVAKPSGETPPRTSGVVDHAAMGHGDVKSATGKTPGKPAVPSKQPSSKGGHDGH